MIETTHTFFAAFASATRAVFLVILLPILSLFGYAAPLQNGEIKITDVSTTSESGSTLATSSLSATTTVPVVKKVPIPISVPRPTPPPVVVTPPYVAATSTNATTTPATATSTIGTIGTTTLAIQSIPLLFGGTTHAGESVPIAYLQMTNTGTEGALLKGFWVKQNGSTPTQFIIGLSTVDDHGGSRGLSGGTEGTLLFQNGLAFAPTNAYFAPGQMRLFTIKAILASGVSAYTGTQLSIDVTAIETIAAVNGQFPIRGTTWTIVQ